MGDFLTPAYLAGIIDGEGSVFCRNGNPHLSVSNTHRPLMEELFKFGGHGLDRRPERGMGTRPGWDWIIQGEAAAIILRACLPYLIVKRERTEQALAEWDQVTGTNHFRAAVKQRARMLALGWTDEHGMAVVA